MTSDSSRARQLLGRCLVWDNHGCMPVTRPNDPSFLPQLQRYRSVGVDAVMLNVGFGEMSIEAHVRMLASMRHWLRARSSEYVEIRTPGDIDIARATGRLAVGFNIEGANAIGNQISLLQLYYDLGVRWMLLAYNANNLVGGGCLEQDRGLTAFGRKVVAEMERIGLQVCLSHTGHRTARDVLNVATRPVIFSHSNPSALQAHPRNIPDDLIRACAATGGTIGINGIGRFLGHNDTRSETFARHIDHVVQLVGPQHVALGIDYPFDQDELADYYAKAIHTLPPGLGYDGKMCFVEPEQLEEIVEILMSWGYQDPDLEALLGGNLMRLARSVWHSDP